MFSKSQTEMSKITALELKSYILLNSGSYFRRVCVDEEPRKWLEVVVKEKLKTYMVVGIHTVKDANIVHQQFSLAHAEGLRTFSPPKWLCKDWETRLPAMFSMLKLPALGLVSSAKSAVILRQESKLLLFNIGRCNLNGLDHRDLESAVLKRSNRWKVFALGDRSEEREFYDMLDADLAEVFDFTDIEGDYQRYKDLESNDEFLVMGYSITD